MTAPGPTRDARLRAEALIKIRRYDQAATLLAQVIASDPADPRPRCLLAQCQLGLGDAGGALETASGAVVANPEYEWAHRLRALALTKLDRPSEAVEAALSAVGLSPRSASAYVVLVESQLAARDPMAARRNVATALELGPNRADVHNAAGNVALRTLRPQEAEEHFRRALSIDPENARAMNNLGVALLKQRRRKQAIHYFAEAAKLDPHLTMPRRNAALAARAGFVTVVIAVLLWVALTQALGQATSDTFGSVAGEIVMVLFGLMVVAGLVRLVRGGMRSEDPKASRQLIRELRRDAPPARSGVVVPCLVGIALFMAIVGLSAASDDNIGAFLVAVLLGWICIVSLVLVLVRRSSQKRR